MSLKRDGYKELIEGVARIIALSLRSLYESVDEWPDEQVDEAGRILTARLFSAVAALEQDKIRGREAQRFVVETLKHAVEAAPTTGKQETRNFLMESLHIMDVAADRMNQLAFEEIVDAVRSSPAPLNDALQAAIDAFGEMPGSEIVEPRADDPVASLKRSARRARPKKR